MTSINATSGNSLPVVSNTSANTSAPASTPEAASTPAAKPARPERTRICDVFEGSVDPEKPAGYHLQFHCPVNVKKQDDPSKSPDQKYAEVIARFDVANNPRYKQDYQPIGTTYCSTFVWDVTKAMGAEIPYWTDKNGKPAEIPAGANVDKLSHQKEIFSNNANSMIEWLEKHGQENGWTKVVAQEGQTVEALAQAAANEGNPTVAAWKNPVAGRSGHVGIVRPGTVDERRGPALAQAGTTNFADGYRNDGFSQSQRPAITYWVHNPPPATAEAATDATAEAATDVAVDTGAAVDAAQE